MDNRVLYQERLAMEQQKHETEHRAQEEKERLRKNLHDLLLNNLAVIARTAEVARISLDRDPLGVRARLQANQDLATETSQQLREFLWVIDDRHKTWEEFCSYLYSWGLETVERGGYAFELDISPSILALPPPSLQLRVCLYRVYREAIINALKHAHATRIRGAIERCEAGVCCAIQDNGIGFDPRAERPGHFGLTHLQDSVQELGGTVTITAGAGQGTCITIQLPV
jgi:signal transduction histidine kinase